MFDPTVAALGVTTQWDDLILALVGGDQVLVALVKGHIATESQWNPSAINPADPSYGLMQVLQGPRGPYPTVTAHDLLEPSTNITLGTEFLMSLVRRYGLPGAIAAYNAGSPRQNSAGQYVNSKGDTRVQAYVDDVLTYQDYYLRQTPPVDAALTVTATAPPTDQPPTDATSVTDTGPSITDALGGALIVGGLAVALAMLLRR